MDDKHSKNITSSQKRIILSLLFVFLIAVLIISSLMYQVFRKSLAENLSTRATEVIDIIDYMVQTSGESPKLIKGINTLATNRDIKLIIVRINEPPVVIASNKAALIGLPTNEIFSNDDGGQSFKFNADADQYTAISSIWLANKFNNGLFTKATVGVVFDTYKTRILLQEQILNTALFLILTTIFAIGLIYYLTNKYIFKPLEVINSSLINNKSNKDFSPIPLIRNDEIGTVANTFNQLFADLYASKKNLRENTERYDLALQGTKVGLVDWDVPTNNLYCSSSLMELLGVDKKYFEPSVAWFTNRTHPDDREMAQSALISHLKFNTEYDIEGRLQHENGNYIWMRVRGQAVRDKEGRATRMVGYYVDISKQKEHEHFMSSLYLLSADATITIQSKMKKILKEATNYLKLSCGAICKFENDKCIIEACQCPDEYELCGQLEFDAKDTICHHTIEENDIVCLHDIGSSKLKNIATHDKHGINVYVGMPLYVHGRIYGTVSFFDKKFKHKAFNNREKSFVRLICQWIGNEIMRAEYISYLHDTESRLEEAVEELTNTNSELESFTHAASHDLQEPLRMITNFTGLLERNYANRLDTTAKDYLNILSKSAFQMRTLISGLLDYAHASKENEKIENLDLNEILNNVYANLEKQIRESQAEIVFSNLPTIRANKASMISLLQNLISNGIKFQATGNQPVIEIKTFQYAETWVISVTDNGIGIDNDYQAKIFEPFKRLHAKSEYEGTGIGLAVCKKIIARAGGTMWIESENDAGSTFFVSIPNLKTELGKAA